MSLKTDKSTNTERKHCCTMMQEPSSSFEGIEGEIDAPQREIAGEQHVSLNTILKVEKTPVRSEPSRAQPQPFCMSYRTHRESLTEPGKSEIEKRRLRRNATGVTFDKIAIREYPVELGDNPAVSRGAPLTIDWTPLNHVEFFVEDYEKQKPKRKEKSDLFLSFQERQQILEESGYSGKEIRQALASVNNARAQRMKTVSGLMKGKDKWEESLERLLHHIKKYMSHVHPGIKKQKSLEEWLMQYHLNIDKSDIYMTPQASKYLSSFNKSSETVHAQ